MSFDLGISPARRRPSLTPMIDVVFLLLVFFMLAARFGADTAVPLTLGGGNEDYSGPPRLVTITADSVLLNGRESALADLGPALLPLTESPQDIIVLQPADDTSLQRAVEVMDTLRAAGFTSLVILEGGR